MEKRLWISCGNNCVGYSSRIVRAEERSFTALTVHALSWEGVAKAGLVMSFVMDTWNTAGLSAENAQRPQDAGPGPWGSFVWMHWCGGCRIHQSHCSSPRHRAWENRIALQLCFPVRVPLHNLMPFNWDKQSWVYKAKNNVSPVLRSNWQLRVR